MAKSGYVCDKIMKNGFSKNIVKLRPMKTAFFIVLLFMVVCICLSSCFEQQATISNSETTRKNQKVEDSYFDYHVTEGGYEVSAKQFSLDKQFKGTLYIPETYNGLPVVKISGFAATSGRGITKIKGSYNIETIAGWAFSGNDGGYMSNLESVVFPSNGNLSYIGNCAFFRCNELKTVIVPKTFCKFGNGVFERCYGLVNLVIYNPTPPTFDCLFYLAMEEKHYQIDKERAKSSFTVFVPDESVNQYKSSKWGMFRISPISSFDMTTVA